VNTNDRLLAEGCGGDGGQDRQVPPPGGQVVRHPRPRKSITIGRTQVAFDADVFKRVEQRHRTGRIYDVSSSKFNQVAEIMNPRIARFGLGFQF